MMGFGSVFSFGEKKFVMRASLRLSTFFPLCHHQPPIPAAAFLPQPTSPPNMIPAHNDCYRLERQVAVAAVLQASILTRRIFDSLIRPSLRSTLTQNTSITKPDRSPVTVQICTDCRALLVGDYTVQALVNFILLKYFPNDEIVGEEDSTELLNTTDKKHLEQIVDFTNQALREDRLSTPDDEEIWAKYRDQSRLTEQELVELIDLGNSTGGTTTQEGSRRRFWTLDPIDGTKGFLRGEQYAICLALVVDGTVVLGVIGTPNLPLQGTCCPPGQQPEGVLFFAEERSGAFQRSLDSDNYTKIQMNSLAPKDLGPIGTFCESSESAHSNHQLTVDIANQLKMVNVQSPIRIDSQAKYCILARGDAHLYFRFPTSPEYQEKIWDHAAGSILLSESGGIVTDLNGKRLDFSGGRTLSNNHLGFLACNLHCFDLVLNTAQSLARNHGFLPPLASSK